MDCLVFVKKKEMVLLDFRDSMVLWAPLCGELEGKYNHNNLLIGDCVKTHTVGQKIHVSEQRPRSVSLLVSSAPTKDRNHPNQNAVL